MKKICGFIAAIIILIAGFVYVKAQKSSVLLWDANVEALADTEEEAEKAAKIWYVEEHFGGDAITCTKGGTLPCK